MELNRLPEHVRSVSDTFSFKENYEDFLGASGTCVFLTLKSISAGFANFLRRFGNVTRRDWESRAVVQDSRDQEIHCTTVDLVN